MSTLLLVTILQGFAVILRRQRSKEQTWGGVFTEQGVSNLLQVGWRYHQDENDKTNQLFLHVYDKKKMGYNDDNSVLQGGVEQEVIKSTLPTSTATTMTPPDSNNSALGSGGLPSSTYTGSTPEHPSRQYEEEIKDYNNSQHGFAVLTPPRFVESVDLWSRITHNEENKELDLSPWSIP